MLMENRMRGNAHVGLGGGPGEPERIERPLPRLWPTQSLIKASSDALDEICRIVWNEARRPANKQLAKHLKGARFALWKKPEKLTERQQAKLAWIQTLNAPIYRACLLKEQLRQIYLAPPSATRWRCSTHG